MDEAKLVRWLAIGEVKCFLWIKVAKEDCNDNPTPLTISEVNYLQKLKIVGTCLTIISIDNDKLAFDMEV